MPSSRPLVRDALVAAHGIAVEIIVIKTTGDKVQDRALAEIGGKALWTKALDRALLGGETDCAAHSMKDVETVRPDGSAIAAMLPRADIRDIRKNGVPAARKSRRDATITR